MNDVLSRITRAAFPRDDRRWADALLAELAAIETGRGRLLWLLGAPWLLLDRYALRLAGLITPASLICLVATLVFGVLAFTEYEGLAIEDDWYPMITLIFVAGLFCVSFLNLRRHGPTLRP